MTSSRSSWNRRRFLGTTIAGGATLALGPRLARPQALGANDRLRIGVVGTGGRARHLMRMLKELPGCEMVAVSDVYEPRLLEAACRLDYPADRLEIQVLDDSDDETAAVMRRLCERYRRRGANVTYLHRVERTGYKAGALAAGLELASGALEPNGAMLYLATAQQLVAAAGGSIGMPRRPMSPVKVNDP